MSELLMWTGIIRNTGRTAKEHMPCRTSLDFVRFVAGYASVTTTIRLRFDALRFAFNAIRLSFDSKSNRSCNHRLSYPRPRSWANSSISFNVYLTAQREWSSVERDHVTPLLRDKLHWLRARERITFKLFCVAGPAAWNSLPSDIRTASTLSTFKNRLKTHLFLQSYIV